MIVKVLPFLMLLAATHQAATNTTVLSTVDHASDNKTNSHPIADPNTADKTVQSEDTDKTDPLKSNKTISTPVSTDKTNTVAKNETNVVPATDKVVPVAADKKAKPDATNEPGSVPATNNKTTEVVTNKTLPTTNKPEGSALNKTAPGDSKNTTKSAVSNTTLPTNKPSGPSSNASIPSGTKPTDTVTPNKTSPANKTTSVTTEKSIPTAGNKTVSPANKTDAIANKAAVPSKTNKTSDGKGIDVGNHLTGVDPDTLSCDPLGQIFLLLPHFTDCSKFFMCAHGAEVEFSCAPGGLYFDFEQQICDFSWRTRCWLRTLPDSEIEGSGEQFDFLSDEADVQSGAVRSLTADAVANSVRPRSADTQKALSSPINCQRADSASKLVPYKGDCQRYWRCANGVAQSAYCNDGLFFNERTQQCDFEANVKCLVEQEDELKTEFILYKTK